MGRSRGAGRCRRWQGVVDRDRPLIERTLATRTPVRHVERPSAIGRQSIEMAPCEPQSLVAARGVTVSLLKERGSRQVIQPDVEIYGAVVVELHLHLNRGDG